MTLHPSTFEYLKPTDDQIAQMADCREVTRHYAEFLQATLPEGADKTYILRKLRELAMWVNVCITREADGTPRVAPPADEPADPVTFNNVSTSDFA